MITWTPNTINLKHIPYLTETLLVLMTEDGKQLLITDSGVLWSAESTPTDIWTRKVPASMPWTPVP